MIKRLLLLVSLLGASAAFSAPQTGAQVLEALSQFNPATVITGYTANPKEAGLAAQDKEGLQAEALKHLKDNETAAFIREQAVSRPRFKDNPRSLENRYAENLLSHAGDALDGRCYEVARPCPDTKETLRCEERRPWQMRSCGKRLEIRFKPLVQTVERVVIGAEGAPYTLPLTGCSPYQACTPSQLIQLNANCHHLSLTVSDGNTPVPITVAPTCASPVAQLSIRGIGLYGEYIKSIKVTLTQWLPEDHWVDEDCAALKQSVTKECLPEPGERCVDANPSKEIEGYPVKRPCWQLQTEYRCQGDLQSQCKEAMAAGCSQTQSDCTHQEAGFCDSWQQTFVCKKACNQTTLICPGKPQCADGRCDKSEAEPSNDIQEGLAGLAALAGSASGIAETADSLKPNAFAGKPVTCKKTIAGVRDCCRDSGWGDWVVHCPASMQELMKARQENRAVYLGHTKDGLEKTYVYCVFPSLLAAIVQREGRGLQLKLSFGTAKAPDCRGISPKELAALHFDAMDFTPLTREIQARLTLPDAGKAGERLKAAVEGQYKEKSHD